MVEVFEKSFSLILVMITAYIFKVNGILKKEDFPRISTIMFKLALPLAVISNLSNVEFDLKMLTIIPIGFMLNAVTMGIGWLINPKNPKSRPFDMLNISGFNIGSFGLPFVMSFLGPEGIMAACLFDAGNSIMCTGGNYAIASSVKYAGEGKGGLKASDFFKRLFSSVPFDTYLVMVILRFFKIGVPGMILSFSRVGANANPFLAMIVLGIGINLKMDKASRGHICKLLAIRFSFNLVCIGLCSMMTFYSLEVRQALMLLSATPVSAMSPVFTGLIDEDLEMASTINSICIIFSTVLMMVLLVVLNPGG